MKDSAHLAGLDRYRQGRVLERLLSTASSNANILGAIVIGSFATGEVDPMSDIDIMLVVADGRFEEVWRMRGDIRGTNTLAAWDASRVGLDKAGVHKWVTQELVLVECVITEPGGFRLAEPYRVLVGAPDLAHRLPRRAPILRAEMSEAGLHPVEKAYDKLKAAVRADQLK